ncbi:MULTISPECIES: helix-turn-helix domain-containing protein [unclassified Photobacterium]|uniref:helix-turn-helix domain-containing protein n=1 Tax=unclassified Photobacterium TaxID=2628852 RepID=UPI001EDF15F4|nr:MULTISPECIES: helix-turn-helix domain-containing protein [unclassified Photobacterium]MCG3865333.1 helix-turn-helix transcriptional regulator [Photobacterium sp. Ph6]MCG3876845.1 helix-turn-helix transcriptional regulator [Photobacterium sp. Ph5]
MLDINTAEKFIAARFLLEYSKKDFAGFLGVSVSKITNIENNNVSIPYIYSLAINHMLKDHPMKKNILDILKSNDVNKFSRRIDVNQKVQRLSCKLCNRRHLHIMKEKNNMYFVECLHCHQTMYTSSNSAKRYMLWSNYGVKLDHNLY